MFKLRNKLNKKGGFTLIEMLIVVAIIAILIAVSIPLVSSALEKARHATDDANMRSAVALGHVKALTENLTEEATYYYAVGGENSVTGYLVDSGANGALPADTKSLYESKCTEAAPTDDTKNSLTGTHKECYIKIEVNPTTTVESEVVKGTWVAKSGS